MTSIPPDPARAYWAQRDVHPTWEPDAVAWRALGILIGEGAYAAIAFDALDAERQQDYSRFVEAVLGAQTPDTEAVPGE